MIPKKTFAPRVDRLKDGFAADAKRRDRESTQHRDQEHLQEIAFGKRIEEAIRDDVEQKIDGL
jgi:hypothetical protein